MKLSYVKKAIEEYDSEGKTLCIDGLENKTGINFSHRDLRFTSDVYFCECCHCYRHIVTGIKLSGCIKILLSRNKKIEDKAENEDEGKAVVEITENK